MSAGAGRVGITRWGQVAIPVDDVERATDFYREVLGLHFLFRAGQLAFFDCGGVRLMLDRPEKPEFDHPSSILYFVVPDIQAAHSRLVASGVATVEAPPWLPLCRIMICGWDSSATQKVTSWRL
jgi:methylmalonyl-CoA/ethylmalonyl-CoA epimerase